jgi:hypothetical protein
MALDTREPFDSELGEFEEGLVNGRERGDDGIFERLTHWDRYTMGSDPMDRAVEIRE